ncbi:MAG TPA: L,D-transpeptidase [Alphaproteobacteria bacterium]|nr:L,D-transpeptidase [Alphaproteobacteria bacterium]
MFLGSQKAALLLTSLLLCLSACQAGPAANTANQAIALQIPPESSEQEAVERKVDYIVVQKRDRLVSLWKSGRVLRTYPIMAMGANPVGQKVYEGDERTPEGQYFISDKHVSQNFQKFLGISYPNDHDKKLAKRFGLPPGGQVGIHGDRGGMNGFWQRFDKNWTDGCLALRNSDIEEVYTLVDVGTPILIKP